MLPYILWLLYIGGALGAAWLGRTTLAGFGGCLLLSLLLTPLAVLLALLLLQRRPAR
ncbi:hypothetical protein P2H44_19685 [Albimonas sp. CAU 1670]|uniref:hypothetical protein n=1 Tax=Albimonas sp. CAU 1670 TaxID=3032599 RepID=UPI0023DCE569|nr:hypothetical protein [Albimonas sp. CAU 1670]MDF2234788.1 hypothetical protein [Albimonas sp. CAU 1670]